MAIHATLKIIHEEYLNEPAHIFTDCLNGLYVIKTQIKHLTLHNNHPNKTILQEIVKLLQQRNQLTTLYKVRAHANILGNEKANELAKRGREKEHIDAMNPHEFAHSTPYYYQKDWWHSMNETPDKGHIRFLEKHLIKHDRKYNLEIIATDFPNIDKWIANANIDNELSNEYWTNKHITDSQKTCLLKLRHGQYMGNARKQLFFSREIYPSITCSICNSLEPDTWLHVLLNCRQSHIHALHTKRHNKAVWALRKLLVSSKHSRCYTQEHLMETHLKIRSHHGYSLAHVVSKDVIVMLDLNQILYVSKDYHTKKIPQLSLKTTLKFNLLNLHTAMTDSH